MNILKMRIFQGKKKLKSKVKEKKSVWILVFLLVHVKVSYISTSLLSRDSTLTKPKLWRISMSMDFKGSSLKKPPASTSLSLPELNNTNESDRCGWWFPILSNDVHSDAYKRPKLGGSSGSVRSLVHRANRRESSIILSLLMLSGRLETQLLQRRGGN